MIVRVVQHDYAALLIATSSYCWCRFARINGPVAGVQLMVLMIRGSGSVQPASFLPGTSPSFGLDPRSQPPIWNIWILRPPLRRVARSSE